RSDLTSLVPTQVKQIRESFQISMVYTARNYYMGLYRWLAPLMLDSADVDVVPPAGASTAYYTPTTAKARAPSISRTNSRRHHRAKAHQSTE
ncbi:MAG: hypothetical protein ACLPV4_04325, partial [Solirubrobacteraceae bacterium]